jgi:hypothetical protein
MAACKMYGMRDGRFHWKAISGTLKALGIDRETTICFQKVQSMKWAYQKKKANRKSLDCFKDDRNFQMLHAFFHEEAMLSSTSDSLSD